MRLYSISPQSFGEIGRYEKILFNSSSNIAEVKIQFLRPFCISYFDQLLLNTRSKKIKMYSTYPEANQYLKQCGFEFLADNCECSENFPEENILKLRRFSKLTTLEKDVVKWIEKNVIKFLPALSSELEKKITENFWEIIYNAIEHSNSKHGISVCGQFYPEMGYFETAFCDGGNGIPTVVKSNRSEMKSSGDSECIEWAMQKGTSTKPPGKAGGLGLYFLREFIKINCGVFQIASNSGYFGNVEYEDTEQNHLKNFIRGTLVNIRVIYDKSLYKLN